MYNILFVVVCCISSLLPSSRLLNLESSLEIFNMSLFSAPSNQQLESNIPRPFFSPSFSAAVNNDNSHTSNSSSISLQQPRRSQLLQQPILEDPQYRI
jgi:hypothetical protein